MSIDHEGRERRIRARAQRIWEEEGHPEGQAERHWEEAKELIAIEENNEATLLPNPATQPRDTPPGAEPAEPLLAVESLGDLPGINDQGERQDFPADPRGNG